MQMVHNGQPAVQRQLMPVLLIGCDIGLTLDKDVGLLRLSEFPEVERESWFKLVRDVRAGMQQVRAGRSGIVLPGH